MYTSNNFVDQNDMLSEFSPTFLDHEDYSFSQFLPQEQLMEIVTPSRESVEETMINKAVSSTTINLRDALHNGNGGSCKKVYRMSGKNPRKRSGKKDRHSKIVTAQGTRDRRMRLSLEIARKFFDLQDTLGFGKASKTVEWLLRQAEEAIHELGERCTGDTKSVSCSTECDVVSEIDEGQNVIFKAKSLDRAVSREKTKNKSSLYPVARDSRAKARARAKERTLEKTRRLDKLKSCHSQDSSHNLNKQKSLSSFQKTDESSGSHSNDMKSSLEERSSPQHPGPNKHVVNQSLGINTVANPYLSFSYQNNFVTSQGQSSNNNNNISLPTIPENWSIDVAKLHASYWANLSVASQMADRGKRHMNPCEDPSNHKKRNSDPVQDRLNLQSPPAFRQPNRPNVDKGKRPMHPSEEPSNQKKRIYIPPQDRLILQPPHAFQRPTDNISPSLLTSSGAQILTKRIMAQRIRREREKHLKQNDNLGRLFALSTTPVLPGFQQLPRSTQNTLPLNLRTPPPAVRRPTHRSPITPMPGFELLTSSESLQRVLGHLNPVRQFTDVLPSRAQADPPMGHQNASVCPPESSTSSLLNAISLLPSRAQANPPMGHQNASIPLG